jgi:hypothetical protein
MRGFLLSDQRLDFCPVIEEVTQRMHDLRFGDVQGVGDLRNALTAQVERGDVPHRHAQPIDHRLAATDAFIPHDMRVFGLHYGRHRCTFERVVIDQQNYIGREWNFQRTVFALIDSQRQRLLCKAQSAPRVDDRALISEQNGAGAFAAKQNRTGPANAPAHGLRAEANDLTILTQTDAGREIPPCCFHRGSVW